MPDIRPTVPTNLTRRAVLTAGIGLLGGATSSPTSLQLRPESPPAKFSLAIDDALLRITIEGVVVPFEIPALRARLLSILPVADREVMIVAFGVDREPSITQDLIAIIGWDGSTERILGIENLSWHRADGADLSLRLFATADRRRLLLSYLATIPRRSATDLVRTGWNDFLQWQDGAALVDAPPRPPIPDSAQRYLADIRARVLARIAAPSCSISAPELAPTGLLQPLRL